jgi:uncharacterized membrane protein
VTIAFTIATLTATLTPGISETPLRVILGFPFILFFPGYAFVAALFPGTGERLNEGAGLEGERASDALPRLEYRLGGLERVLFSFGLSIAIVPIIGIISNYTPWGLRLTPVILSVGGFTLISTGIAALRRWRIPEEVRFRVPYRRWYTTARRGLLQPESRTDAILNILLALSILIAVPSVSYAVVAPEQSQGFTEFYLLAENETGALVTEGYPTEFTEGEGKEVVIGVTNRESERINYTVIVTIQRIEARNGSVRVLEEEELRRFHPNVVAGERWTTTYEMMPTMTGTQLRVLFSLYQGDPPPRTTAANAYRSLNLRVNVTASAR